MPCGHVRILIPRERRNSFADCQRLMYPKILQETRKDGIRFKWAVRLARKRLFLRHRHRDHRHQHHHVQVPRNMSVVYSEDRRQNQNNGFLIKKCCNCLHVLIKFGAYWGSIFMHGSHVGREFVRMRRIKNTQYSFYNNFIENIFLLN